MRAVAQFTITNICDVVTSDTAPETPYVGQLWVNTATVPPETMVWDGLGWVLQNNLEELRETVSTHTTRFGEFQSSIDGMNSYVSSLTETVQTLEGEHSGTQETVLEMEAQISELQHSVDGLTVTVQEQFAGGINYVRNSAGLNGITDDWTITGTVSTDSSTDVQSNTTSDSCFVLGDTSTLTQVITGVVPGAYTISVRAKKTGASYTSYFYVQYNGNKYAYLFNTTNTFAGRNSLRSSQMWWTARLPSMPTTAWRHCMSRISSWQRVRQSTSGLQRPMRFTPPRLKSTAVASRFPMRTLGSGRSLRTRSSPATTTRRRSSP